MNPVVVYDTGVASPKRGETDTVTKTIAKGNIFEIVLKSNVHGGYLWYCDNTHEKECPLIKDYSEPLPRYSGTKQHFLFKAQRPGNTKLHFHYKRSWESEEYAQVDLIIQIV
jgi:predicted secreted protein